MAYTLSNKFAENLCKRIVIVQLIIKKVVILCFFGTQCSFSGFIHHINLEWH